MSDAVFTTLVDGTKLTGEDDLYEKAELLETLRRYVEAHQTTTGIAFETKPSMSLRLDEAQRICCAYLISFIAFDAEIVDSPWQSPRDVKRLVSDVPNNSRLYTQLVDERVLSERDGKFMIEPMNVPNALRVLQDV